MITEDYAPFVLADEARLWVEDVVPNAEDVHEASDADVMRFVAQHYEGGTVAFAADVYAYYGYATLAATLRALITN